MYSKSLKIIQIFLNKYSKSLTKVFIVLIQILNFKRILFTEIKYNKNIIILFNIINMHNLFGDKKDNYI